MREIQLTKKTQIEELIYRKYGRTKVFSISQIEKTCNKYYLKFLPVKYYRGSLDEELPYKITQFKEIYKTQHYDIENYLYIMAPKSSFELQSKPVDPLLFYKIEGEDYYYLIHKWGNDLNIFRRGLGLLSNDKFMFVFRGIIAYLMALLIQTLMVSMFVKPEMLNNSIVQGNISIMFWVPFITLTVINLIITPFNIWDGDNTLQLPKIQPFSRFKN